MRFSKIKDNDIANGIGITMSLWTQGCPHHCKGCFNGLPISTRNNNKLIRLMTSMSNALNNNLEIMKSTGPAME